MTAAAALALGLTLAAAPPAGAQGTAAPMRVEPAQTPIVAARYRGGHRFYGGHRYYRGGGYIAGGIAAGIAGAILLNEFAGPRYYYRTGPYFSCDELEYRCAHGEGWACHRLDVSPRC
jgi:hypothetical protein